MKLYSVVVLGVLLFNPSSQAQKIASPAAPQAACAADQTPVRIILKESFRFYPERRDGTHQFFLLEGCSSPAEQNVSRLTAKVSIGKEADADYRETTPKPLEGTLVTQDFEGTYQDAKVIAHGSTNALRSDNGKITAEGNFYTNRDISYSVDGNIVPASLLK